MEIALALFIVATFALAITVGTLQGEITNLRQRLSFMEDLKDLYEDRFGDAVDAMNEAGFELGTKEIPSTETKPALIKKSKKSKKEASCDCGCGDEFFN